ncbi:MAG: hypothetical protein PHR51_02660 [Patescibacteria group bacterium]|nr:hypothetical protein [Patescibacteria group bacterium]
MSFLNIFKLSYYFDNSIHYTFTGMWVVAVILALLIIACWIINYKFAKKWTFLKRIVAERLTRAGYIVGWVGLAWLFFRYESIPYFSVRMWPLLLFIYVVVEVVYLIKWVKKDYPRLKAKKKGMGDKDLYLRKFLGK